MSMQNNYNSIENNLNNEYETLLKESRREMQEHLQMILLGIDSHAAKAKKEVYHHITQLAEEVQSAL